MKATFFIIAVITAGGYLAYSQIPEVHNQVDTKLDQISLVTPDFDLSDYQGTFQIDPEIALLDHRLSKIEQEIGRLKRHERQINAMPEALPIGELFADVGADIGADVRHKVRATMDVDERSDALQALAERMELKAIGH